MSAQLVMRTTAPDWTNNSACSERWLDPGEKLKLSRAPAPVMIAAFAINSADDPRKIQPPQAPACCSGDARFVEVNTTGCVMVPLIIVRPELVIFTPAFKRTTVPA